MSTFFTKNINSNVCKFISNQKIIGSCIFGIIDKNLRIYNIQVNKEYRNNKIGSLLLKEVETYGKQHKNIKSISLTAHEDSDSNLQYFYQKNGFKIVNNSLLNYDDGINIYNLIDMKKYIS
tara:strand:+ start:715 stop:1077 length:363 start_codon:yes stop_codon:yes gene_type:complete